MAMLCDGCGLPFVLASVASAVHFRGVSAIFILAVPDPYLMLIVVAIVRSFVGWGVVGSAHGSDLQSGCCLRDARCIYILYRLYLPYVKRFLCNRHTDSTLSPYPVTT